MASMRDIKRRRTSIQGTQQITKAMKLVSTVKLQRARSNAEKSHSYFDTMYRTVCSILARVGESDHRYLKGNDSKRKAIVVITSNRGLAGGYNSNVVKLITANSDFVKEDIDLYTIGNKGYEAFHRHGYNVVRNLPDIIEAPTYADAMGLTDILLKSYSEGEIGEIYLAYTLVGFLRALPKHEYDEIENGSSDWSKNGEQYSVLSKHKGIILAEKNYLPVDKRGNVNVLVVGRIWFW